MFDKVIILGIFVSLIYSELTGFSPSGLIVPGYIVLNINNPSRIGVTLLVSLTTFLILKFLSNYAIIYGKRQFALSVGISLIVNFILTMFFPASLGVIGNIIPGIIANEWTKEGILISSISLSIVVLVIVLAMLAVKMPIF